jgi:hypothetical protein
VWIDGVPEVELGHLGADWMVQLKGAQVLLRHRSEQIDLDDVLAFSGEAFSLCHSDHWELRTSLSVPIDSLGELAKAFGYEGRWRTADTFGVMVGKGVEASRQQTQGVLDDLWSEIDAARPVLVSGIDGHCGNWYVATGYDSLSQQMQYVGGEGPLWDGISGLTLDTCGDPGVGKLGFWDSRVRGAIRSGFVGGWLSDVAFILGEKTQHVSSRDRVVAALQLATHMVRPGALTRMPYFGVTYFFGEDAYRQWARDLHDLDYPADVNAPRPTNPEVYVLDAMTYQVQQIVRGRSAAATFCDRSASVVPEAAHCLRAAAEAYRGEARWAADGFAPFLSGDEESWQAWLSDATKRRAGATSILRMLEKERAAVAEVEKALDLVG